MKKKVAWQAHAGAQTDFLSSPYFEVFYGGAAGPGKSDALLMGSLRGIGSGRYRAILFRRSYPELRNSLIPRSLEVFSLLRPKPVYNKADHMWRFESGATIQFGHLQYDDTIHDYQSAEFSYIGFDELTHFMENQYLYMMSRCRSTDAGLPKFMRSASNPGSVGHAWVKKRFVDPGAYAVTESGKGLYRTFIPGKLEDNPTLMKNDPMYRERLNALPEAHRRALLYGDWNSFEGQYFMEWRHDVHVVKMGGVPEGWRKYRSIDWGYSPDPAICGWFAVSPEGHHMMYREYVVNEQLASVFARNVLDMSEKDGEIADTVGDPSMWQRNGQTGQSIAQTLIENGLVVRKANNERLNGWMRMHEMLAIAPDGKPWLQISERCPKTIKCIPELVHDIKSPGDLDTTQYDHPADMIRYHLMSWPTAPIPDQPLFRITATDEASREYWKHEMEDLQRDMEQNRNGDPMDAAFSMRI